MCIEGLFIYEKNSGRQPICPIEQLFPVTTPPVKMQARKVRRLSGLALYQNTIPLRQSDQIALKAVQILGLDDAFQIQSVLPVFFRLYAAAPKNLRFVKKNNYAYVSWSPVYGAEHYYVYTSNSENGTYKKLKNNSLKSDIWYWGFPQSFGISINPKRPYYMKVSAVVNGMETPLSPPLKISR